MKTRKILGVAIVFLGLGIGISIGHILVKSHSDNILPTPVVAVPTPTPKISPKTLIIPRLNIKAPIDPVGLTPNGSMGVPSEPDRVVWYKYGPLPGELGNSVIAGHVDWYTGPAIFYDVAKLNPGDEIIITTVQDAEIIFRVKEKKIYRYNDFPINDVFGSVNLSKLNLITCTGIFDTNQRNYSHRLVIFSEKQP